MISLGDTLFAPLIFAIKRVFLVRSLRKGSLSWLFKNIDFVVTGLVRHSKNDLRILKDPTWELGLHISGFVSLSKEPHKIGGGSASDDPTVWAASLYSIRELREFWNVDNDTPLPYGSVGYLTSCVSVMIFK